MPDQPNVGRCDDRHLYHRADEKLVAKVLAVSALRPSDQSPIATCLLHLALTEQEHFVEYRSKRVPNLDEVLKERSEVGPFRGALLTRGSGVQMRLAALPAGSPKCREE